MSHSNPPLFTLLSLGHARLGTRQYSCARCAHGTGKWVASGLMTVGAPPNGQARRWCAMVGCLRPSSTSMTPNTQHDRRAGSAGRQCEIDGDLQRQRGVVVHTAAGCMAETRPGTDGTAGARGRPAGTGRSTPVAVGGTRCVRVGAVARVLVCGSWVSSESMGCERSSDSRGKLLCARTEPSDCDAGEMFVRGFLGRYPQDNWIKPGGDRTRAGTRFCTACGMRL